MSKSVYLLGINVGYHELSACLIKNGKVVAAVEEERFSRIKRGKKALVSNSDVLPEKSIEYCLSVAGIRLKDVDYVGLSMFPSDRLKHINIDSYFIEGDWGSEKGEKLFYEKIMRLPLLLNKLAGRDISGNVVWVPHHLCHASSAFFVSPFKESAVLTVDGIGELSTTWLGYGDGNNLQRVKEIYYPNSLGFLWEKFSQYLGFTEYDSSKIMGLSAYGNPKRFYKVFQKIVKLKPDGKFVVDIDVMRYRVDDFSPLERMFKVEKISSPAKIGNDQEDVAAALQKITDDIILHLVGFLSRSTGSKNICLAGGVALNCVSNSKIMNSGLYKDMYVQPAANDAGTALGAAYHIWHHILKHERDFVMDHVYWGPSYSNREIKSALAKRKVSYLEPKNLTREVAKKLTEGNVVGWFQGRVEWGPRALGNRTLLADPRRLDMKEILNQRIKRREPFRPFAPSVLKEKAGNWLRMTKNCKSISTEFMEINFDVKKSKRKKIPAVTHADGTSRVQLVNKKTNPLYHRLISDFYKLTGVPMVLNTSLNESEPIVCSPEDAIKTFLRTKMDYLAIGKYLVRRSDKV